MAEEQKLLMSVNVKVEQHERCTNMPLSNEEWKTFEKNDQDQLEVRIIFLLNYVKIVSFF